MAVKIDPRLEIWKTYNQIQLKFSKEYLPADNYGDISIYCYAMELIDLRQAKKGSCFINQSVVCTCCGLTSAARYRVTLTNTKAGFTSRETEIGLIYTSNFIIILTFFLVNFLIF